MRMIGAPVEFRHSYPLFHRVMAQCMAGGINKKTAFGIPAWPYTGSSAAPLPFAVAFSTASELVVPSFSRHFPPSARREILNSTSFVSGPLAVDRCRR